MSEAAVLAIAPRPLSPPPLDNYKVWHDVYILSSAVSARRTRPSRSAAVLTVPTALRPPADPPRTDVSMEWHVV
eukprot:1861618-Heterocapsa_arctica.AAC.1